VIVRFSVTGPYSLLKPGFDVPAEVQCRNKHDTCTPSSHVKLALGQPALF